MHTKIRTAAVIYAAAVLAAGCSFMNHQQHTGCRVTGKDVLQHVSGGKDSTSTSFERRLTTTCGTFRVQDSVVGGFNSYDVWTSIEVNKVYDIETGGYRMGFASVFPTVTKVTPR